MADELGEEKTRSGLGITSSWRVTEKIRVPPEKVPDAESFRRRAGKSPHLPRKDGIRVTAGLRLLATEVPEDSALYFF